MLAASNTYTIRRNGAYERMVKAQYSASMLFTLGHSPWVKETTRLLNRIMGGNGSRGKSMEDIL